MHKRHILKTVALASLLAAAGLASAQTKLKWAHVYETSEPFHKYSVWAGEEIKKRTNGKYEIKVFPASSLGPGFVRELRGPLRDIELIATGGVDGTDAGAYLEAGCVAVGVGGALVNADRAGRRAIVAATS